jgi:hypothetical protein
VVPKTINVDAQLSLHFASCATLLAEQSNIGSCWQMVGWIPAR